MAAIARQFRAMLGRLGNPRRGGPSDIADHLVATKSVGPVEFEDFGEPLWGITGQTLATAGRFSTLSLLSDFDLAIQRVNGHIFETGFGPINANVNIGVPPSTYDLFEFPGAAFAPGLRPSIDRFNAFSTTLVSSQSVGIQPLGMELFTNSTGIDIDNFGLYLNVPNGLFPYAQSNRQTTGHEVYFDPPLWLPSGIFLTFQPGAQDVGIRMSVEYREMPNAFR